MAISNINLDINSSVIPINIELDLIERKIELELGNREFNLELDLATASGDMKKSVYDINNNSIVDNAEKVNGFIVEEDLLEGTEQRITDVENNKVDKVAGKGLSTNDYTTDEKTKLSSIAENAEVNVNADWNATDGDGQILNKPSTFPPSTHTHDDRYFTETEVNNLLALKADKAQEDWITPTLLNSATGSVQYRKNKFGTVEFRGYITIPTIGVDGFILPSGYVPYGTQNFLLMVGDGAAYAHLRIYSSGEVRGYNINKYNMNALRWVAA
jgi:hypothetical protein